MNYSNLAVTYAGKLEIHQKNLWLEVKLDYEQNVEKKRSEKKELLERKIGWKKAK